MATRKPTTIRLTDPLDAAIRDFAEQMGISFNAALRVLLTEALTARGLNQSQARSEAGTSSVR